MMATKHSTQATDARTGLAEAVSQQMPGWKLVAGTFGADAMESPDESAGVAQGVDVQTLRKKFLSQAVADAVASTVAANRSVVSKQVEVFKVEPAKGVGPSRVAERRNGKITIVSG